MHQVGIQADIQAGMRLRLACGHEVLPDLQTTDHAPSPALQPACHNAWPVPQTAHRISAPGR